MKIGDTLSADTRAALKTIREAAAMLEGVERVNVTGDFAPLAEAAGVTKSGKVRLKVIQPGWGSSGFYGREMLERDGPVAFPSGTQQFWDHPTESAARERPERSLRDLAAVTTSAAVFDENGPHGAGLYADAEVFAPYRELVAELAPHIGVSIHTPGERRMGEAEGRKGYIVERLLPGGSVDFVTQPGAGGKVAQLFESARNHESPKEDEGMDEKERKAYEDRIAEAEAKLTEANAKVVAETTRANDAEARAARAEEVIMLGEATKSVTALVDEADLPDVTKARLRESLAANPPVKDGKLDADALKARTEKGIAAEAAYIAELSGAGKVRDQGGSTAGATDAQASSALVESYQRLGLTEEQAKVAAAGRR